MLKKVSIGLLFILAILAGNLTSLLSADVGAPGQPYQVAVSREYLNYNIQELEKKVKQLEMELNSLKQASTELEKSFTDYQTKTDNELNKLKKSLEDHLKSTGGAESRMKRPQ